MKDLWLQTEEAVHERIAYDLLCQESRIVGPDISSLNALLSIVGYNLTEDDKQDILNPWLWRTEWDAIDGLLLRTQACLNLSARCDEFRRHPVRLGMVQDILFKYRGDSRFINYWAGKCA